MKAGTSIGANYREANRAESRSDFIRKIASVEKEASEAPHWWELLEQSNMGSSDERQWLLQEVSASVGVFTSAGKTAKARRGNS